MANKKYADVKYYQTKLDNIMKKIKITKYYQKFGKDYAFVSFKYKNKYYQINHSMEKANENIENGSDLFAEIVLTIEDLVHISERNICSFEDWLSNFEQKAGTYELPDCFKKLGFDGRYMPNKKNVDYKVNELAKVLDPKNVFGDKDKYNELMDCKSKCYDYLNNLEK